MWLDLIYTGFRKKVLKRTFGKVLLYGIELEIADAQKMWRWPTEPLANEEANGKLRRTRAMP